MIAESQSFRRQVLWFTTLVSRGENLPPLYRALAEAGAVKVVKKEMAQGKSKAALSPGPLWMTTSVAVLSPVNAKSSVRAAAVNQAAAAGGGGQNLIRLHRRAHISQIKMLFHLAIKGKTHRPLLER